MVIHLALYKAGNPQFLKGLFTLPEGKIMKRLVIILGIAVALSGLRTLSARARLMDPSLTFTLTNFPGRVPSITSTLGSGLTTVDTVQVFSVQVPTGGGGEWDFFYFSTSDGGPLAANTGLNWQIDANFTLTQAVNFDGIEDQWTTGGVNPPNGLGGTPVPVTSLTPSGFINFAGTGPLGDGYVNGYGTTGHPFSNPIAAGPNDFPTFVNPYSFAYANGIPTDANGFNIAYHFDPQSQTIPEPSTLIIWSVLGGGAAVTALRRRKSGARWSKANRKAIHDLIENKLHS